MVKKTASSNYYESIGKRKEAVARIRLYVVTGKDKTITVNGLKIKQGEIFVNKKPIETVFPSKAQKTQYLKPLKLVKAEDRFAVSALLKGGGLSGQLDAFVHGLARALEKTDKETLRPILKKENLLTRDSRIKERRKVGTGGKARRKKQSPKR